MSILAAVVLAALPHMTGPDVSLWVDPRVSRKAVTRAVAQMNALSPVRWHVGGPGVMVDVRVGDPGPGNAGLAVLHHRADGELVRAEVILHRRWADFVLLHELGHVLGLPHSDRCPGDVMCPRVDEQGRRFASVEGRR